MTFHNLLRLSTFAVLCLASSAAVAQTSSTSYQGDPDVYKVIYEDQNFRVIAANWKKGLRDKVDSHPVPSVYYGITDCIIRLYSEDGKINDITTKAGTAGTTPVTPSHSAENVGPADCQLVFVERK